ncbi:recombinase family protein [Luteibacter aegosomatissinici]|uniref:recombinase family protein n=1 Tax=Luteibacter aegosomatissinici TaxID=2911539 RepID=UPI001FF70B08|nr:recombinase family protein [Luteibacter aegosomatissinici]UPG92846.1 recombinase family protein [Luteibacter aegosomatissinici]
MSGATTPESPILAAAYMRMSTDMQQYSILNQTLAISAYADSHQMRVVRTYRDEGKSGLTIENRPGLLSLMKDITRGRLEYSTVLVLDVSRWGRFQNVDESAYYEFLCWKAGITVRYVAELFENDGSPFAMIVKGLKRAMAAEYSRELSGKTVAAHRQLASRGYHQGASPGYGLRRMLIDQSGKRRQILTRGERKGTQTDRVVLVPGPVREQRTIRWMFQQVVAGKTFTAIARDLNDKGTTTTFGKPWTYGRVHEVITSERYTGTLVYGREAKRLGGPLEHRPEASWIRAEGAIRPIVSRELFDAAQAAHRRQNEHMSNDDIVVNARRLLEREGRLSVELIRADPTLPDSHSVARRFGGLTPLYRLLGYTQPRNSDVAAARALITRWRQSVTGFVAEWLGESGSKVERCGWVLCIDGAWTVSFSVLRAVGRGRMQYFNHRAVEDTDIVVFVRTGFDEPAPRDYLVLPRVLFPVWPRTFCARNGPLIDGCTYPSLAILGDLARLSRRDAMRCG